MTVRLVDVPIISEEDLDSGAVNLSILLDASETISSATVVEQTTGHLTITSVGPNVAELVVKRKRAAIGKAVQFLVTGQQAGQSYDLLV